MAQHKRTICVAGKNDIACLFLSWAVQNHRDLGNFVVVCTADDSGKHHWQRSLRFTAKQLAVPEVTLDDIYQREDLLFLSLEFDRIVKPERFVSNQLFNIHFSALPKYRGVATSVWPLLLGEFESGVTLHRIDSGIDTGAVIAQKTFEISEATTARDLYQSCLDEGLALVKREFMHLLQDHLTSSPQSVIGATYFGRNSIDYRNPSIDFCRTAWQVHNSLRAFSFHEYQYPAHPVAGRVARSRISNIPSDAKPGEYTPLSRWTGRVATLDVDVQIELSPYDELYAWCRGEQDQPEEFDELLRVAELDRVDANGWTPLVVASYFGNTEACRLLLESGADPNATGLRGTHALMYAKEFFKRSADESVFALLLAYGADANRSDVHGFTTRDYIAQDPELIALLSKLALT